MKKELEAKTQEAEPSTALEARPTFVGLTLADLEPTNERPKDLDPNDLSGTEDIGADEIKLPRLAIAQGLSPQMIPGDPKYIEGLSMFSMFNDVTSEVYGKGPLVLVPVHRHVTRIEFDPNDQKVPLDRNVPAGDKRLEWDRSVTPNLPPRATEFVEFVCMLIHKDKEPEPVVVSIKTTNKYQRDAAKMWSSFIKLRNAAIYRGFYKISTGVGKGKTKEGQDTNFGIFIVKNAGFVPTSTESGRLLVETAKNFHESLQNKVIIIDREPGSDDGTDFDPAKIEPSGKTEM